MVQQSPSRSTAEALDPIIKALIAKELLNHPDIDVNILVTCCICDVLTITTPYNHEKMKEFFEQVVVTFEKLSSTCGGCYTKMMKVLETLSSVKIMELICFTCLICTYKFSLALKIIFICCHIQDGENFNHDHGGKAFPHELVRLLVTSVKKYNQIALPVCS
nr:phospholipase-like protein [Tanacetum cinerariifolium]